MAMALQSYILHLPTPFSLPQIPSHKISATHPSSPLPTRRALSLFTITTFLSGVAFSHNSNYSWSKPSISDFAELPNSGGVKALDLRIGGDGELPSYGDKVVIHYYGRLAAKQGWRFDSTYDHKDENGEPIPFEFVLDSGRVISGIESAVRSMKVGGIRRVVIPPSQGYQSTSQEPIPPNHIVWLRKNRQEDRSLRLELIKDDFVTKYGDGKAATIPANGLNKEYGPKLKEHMQYCMEHPEEISKFAKLKAQVSEVKGVMMESIEKILGRGEAIEVLLDKTENLHHQAQEFKSTGTRHHRQMWLQNMKIKLIILAIVIVLILVIVLSVFIFLKRHSALYLQRVQLWKMNY